MPQNTAQERPDAVPGETNIYSVSLDGKLDSGETITGTPTVVEVTTSDLTISSITVSSAELTINDRAVAAGRAIQFKVAGQDTASAPYRLKITAATSAGQTKILYVWFEVRDE